MCSGSKEATFWERSKCLIHKTTKKSHRSLLVGPKGVSLGLDTRDDLWGTSAATSGSCWATGRTKILYYVNTHLRGSVLWIREERLFLVIYSSACCQRMKNVFKHHFIIIFPALYSDKYVSNRFVHVNTAAASMSPPNPSFTSWKHSLVCSLWAQSSLLMCYL